MQEMQEARVQSLSWEDPWRRKWQPTPVFSPGESHGQRSWVSYSPWGGKKSDTRHNWACTCLHTHIHTHTHSRINDASLKQETLHSFLTEIHFSQQKYHAHWCKEGPNQWYSWETPSIRHLFAVLHSIDGPASGVHQNQECRGRYSMVRQLMVLSI